MGNNSSTTKHQLPPSAAQAIVDFTCKWKGFLMAGSGEPANANTLTLETSSTSSVTFTAALATDKNVHVMGMLDAIANDRFSQLKLLSPLGNIVISYPRPTTSSTKTKGTCFAHVWDIDYKELQEDVVMDLSANPIMLVFESIAYNFGARWMSVCEPIESVRIFTVGRWIFDETSWERRGYWDISHIDQLVQLMDQKTCSESCKTLTKTGETKIDALSQLLDSSEKISWTNQTELGRQLNAAVTLRGACHTLAAHVRHNPSEVIRVVDTAYPTALKSFEPQICQPYSNCVIYVKIMPKKMDHLAQDCNTLRPHEASTTAPGRLYATILNKSKFR